MTTLHSSNAELPPPGTPRDPYARHYSDKGFGRKLAHHARRAGREVVEKALMLHYTARSAATPAWARTAIYGALGYFILPLDAVPDFVPVVGFGDDLGILLGAMAATAVYLTDDVKARARDTAANWFGPRARR